MASPTGSFFKTFFGRGRWKFTIPAIIGLSVFNRFYPGQLDVALRYVWSGYFAPLASLLLMCLVMWVVLGFLWNKLTKDFKKWF